MSRILPAPLVGVLSALFVIVNTIFWSIPLLSAALIKSLLPQGRGRRRARDLTVAFARNWVACNNLLIDAMTDTKWDIEGIDDLALDGSYLVNANHQCWADIPVLQRIFHGRIPFLTFFLKKELVWVPILGLAWKGLEFPFMQRYSRDYIAKHPAARGKDLETTRKMCERLRGSPIAIMNFLEGTRLTPDKRRRQKSPYAHLLKPKAGGIAFVIGAIGDQLDCLLDVTVGYPGCRPSLWAYISGDVPRVVVRVQRREIPQSLVGCDYANDDDAREVAQQWVSRLWREKDALLDELLPDAPSG